MKQMEIDFDTIREPYGGPGHNATDTSIAAAESMRPSYRTLQFHVLALIASSRVGLADWELTEFFPGVTQCNTIVPRRRELVLKGLVEDSGVRLQNPATHRYAIVWVSTAFGAQCVQQSPIE